MNRCLILAEISIFEIPRWSNWSKIWKVILTEKCIRKEFCFSSPKRVSIPLNKNTSIGTILPGRVCLSNMLIRWDFAQKISRVFVWIKWKDLPCFSAATFLSIFRKLMFFCGKWGCRPFEVPITQHIQIVHFPWDFHFGKIQANFESHFSEI